MELEFEWDDEKNEINKQKHHIDFETAAWVFYDNNHLEIYDENHSIDEDRYIAIGMVGKLTIVLYVVYTPRENENVIRIISARKATKKEREEYYDSTQNDRYF